MTAGSVSTDRTKVTMLCGLACVALLLPSCRTNCEETVTRAEDAAIVDVADVGGSGVLQARLTASGEPLTNRGIEFRVRLRSGEYRFVGEATTDGDGVARLDLKQSPLDLGEAALGDSYRALFASFGRYCSSRDEADLVTTSGP